MPSRGLGEADSGSVVSEASMNSVSRRNECLGLNGSCLRLQSGSHV